MALDPQQAIDIVTAQTKLFELQEWIDQDINAAVKRGDLNDLIAICLTALQKAQDGGV